MSDLFSFYLEGGWVNKIPHIIYVDINRNHKNHDKIYEILRVNINDLYGTHSGWYSHKYLLARRCGNSICLDYQAHYTNPSYTELIDSIVKLFEDSDYKLKELLSEDEFTHLQTQLNLLKSKQIIVRF